MGSVGGVSAGGGHTGGYTGGGGGAGPPQRDLICLCTPAPKVPRPRNGEFHLSFQFLTPSLFFLLPPISLGGSSKATMGCGSE